MPVYTPPHKKKTKPEPIGKKETGTFSRLAARAKSIDVLSKEVGVKPPSGGTHRIAATGKAPVKGTGTDVVKASSRVEREKATRAAAIKAIKDKRAEKAGGIGAVASEAYKTVSEAVKKHLEQRKFGKGGVPKK